MYEGGAQGVSARREQQALSVTVVIPAYNEQANIARLVRQVLDEPWTTALSLQNVIVVDDCSDDGTSDVAQQLADEYDRVRVTRHRQRSGKNAGMRTGIAANEADVIVFVDADTSLASGCLTRMVQLLQDDPSLAGASCINAPLPARSWRERASRFQALLIAELRRYGHQSLARVYALRSSAIATLTLPDNIYDDLYIMRWLNNHGQRYAVRPDAVAYIRAATGLRDFAKQTVRTWRAVAALDDVLPRRAATATAPGGAPIMLRSVARAAALEPVGFLLYVLWRTIISVTPTSRWLPVVDHTRYDTSESTKDLGI